jgi:outer membrane protein OmpA-like peptidoglycan-associated protein
LAILKGVDRLELGVEVDNARHVPLLSLASRMNGRLPLTTIAPRQRRAIVKISVLKNGRPTVVDQIQVTGIALGMHEHPQIDLEGSHDGRGRVALTLYLNGKRYTAKTVDVSRFLPRRSSPAWLVAVAALLLAAVGGLAYLLIQGDLGAGRQPPRTATAGGAETGAADTRQRPAPEPDATQPPTRDSAESDADTRQRPAGQRGGQAGDASTSADVSDTAEAEAGDEAGGSSSDENRTAAADPDAPSREKSPPEDPRANAQPTGTPQRPAGAADTGGGADAPVAAESDSGDGGVTREGAVADSEARQPSFAGPVDDVNPPSKSDPVVVYFLPDSSAILPEVRSRLSRLYGVLRRHPEYRLVIEGHCAIAGSEAGRAEISDNRAQNVRDVLAGLGWDFGEGSRVVGEGATDPETTDESLQYLNRRVEIWALPPASQ